MKHLIQDLHETFRPARFVLGVALFGLGLCVLFPLGSGIDLITRVCFLLSLVLLLLACIGPKPTANRTRAGSLSRNHILWELQKTFRSARLMLWLEATVFLFCLFFHLDALVDRVMRLGFLCSMVLLCLAYTGPEPFED